MDSLCESSVIRVVQQRSFHAKRRLGIDLQPLGNLHHSHLLELVLKSILLAHLASLVASKATEQGGYESKGAIHSFFINLDAKSKKSERRFR